MNKEKEQLIYKLKETQAALDERKNLQSWLNDPLNYAFNILCCEIPVKPSEPARILPPEKRDMLTKPDVIDEPEYEKTKKIDYLNIRSYKKETILYIFIIAIPIITAIISLVIFLLKLNYKKYIYTLTYNYYDEFISLLTETNININTLFILKNVLLSYGENSLFNTQITLFFNNYINDFIEYANGYYSKKTFSNVLARFMANKSFLDISSVGCAIIFALSIVFICILAKCIIRCQKEKKGYIFSVEQANRNILENNRIKKEKYNEEQKIYEQKLNAYNNDVKHYDEYLKEYETKYTEYLIQKEKYDMEYKDYLKANDIYNAKIKKLEEKALIDIDKRIKKQDLILMQLKEYEINENHYTMIPSLIKILEMGRADSLKEAINVKISDDYNDKLHYLANEKNEIERQRLRELERYNQAMEKTAKEQIKELERSNREMEQIEQRKAFEQERSNREMAEQARRQAEEIERMNKQAEARQRNMENVPDMCLYCPGRGYCGHTGRRSGDCDKYKGISR